MSIDFATAGAELENYLKPALPSTWLVQAAEPSLGRTTKVTLTYEEGDLTDDVVGQGLPKGTIGIRFTLMLSTPETDAAKGWPRLKAESAHLLRVLDNHPELLWTSAERGVLNTGESVYTIPIIALTTYLEGN